MHDIFKHHAVDSPEAVALEEGCRRFTYSDLYQMAVKTLLPYHHDCPYFSNQSCHFGKEFV